jgi:hypothetical protein
MLAPVDETTSPQTSTPEPGSAIGVVAAKFAERGLDVRVPGEQQNYAVTIFESGNTHCRVEVEDDAGVLVAYFMPIREAAPGDIAGMVRRFLSAGDDFPPGLAGRLYRDATLKGAVGREMNALGLKVCLDVIEDHDYYSVTAEVVVGNPVKPERGEVRLSDDTWFQWECCYDALSGGPAEVADTITEALGFLSHRVTVTAPGASCADLHADLAPWPLSLI